MAAGLPVILKETDSHQRVSGQGTDNTYVYGLDLISVTGRTGSQTYFLSDGLGSTVNLTDGSGNTTATFAYDVFGELRPPSSPANQWLFTGEQRDPDSGLYYLRARYYDPAVGRFLSQDPLPTGNLYAYVGNNPVNLIDPAGLQGAGDDAAAVCAAAAVAGTTATAATAGGGGVTVVGAGSGVAAVCLGSALVAVCVEGGCELVGDAAVAVAGLVEDVGALLKDILFSKGGASDKSILRGVQVKVDTYLEHCYRLQTGKYDYGYENFAGAVRTVYKKLLNEVEKLGPAARKQADEALRQAGVAVPGTTRSARILSGEKPPC